MQTECTIETPFSVMVNYSLKFDSIKAIKHRAQFGIGAPVAVMFKMFTVHSIIQRVTVYNGNTKQASHTVFCCSMMNNDILLLPPLLPSSGYTIAKQNKTKQSQQDREANLSERHFNCVDTNRIATTRYNELTLEP